MQQYPTTFDQAYAINWCRIHNPVVLGGFRQFPLPTPKYNVVGNHNLLTHADIAFLAAKFPQQAHDRSAVSEIVIEDEQWVSADSTSRNLRLTTDRKESASSTSFVGAYTNRTAWPHGIAPKQIQLFNIPHDVVEPHYWSVRRTIAAQALVRELAYNIIAPAAYSPDYQLEINDGALVEGITLLNAYADASSVFEPISRRAFSFRGPDNSFDTFENEGERLTAICEDLSETIAARVLGFSFGESEKLNDRSMLTHLVDNFLHAKQIKAGSSIDERTSYSIEPTPR